MNAAALSEKKKNSFSTFSELPVTFNVMIYDSPCVQKAEW